MYFQEQKRFLGDYTLSPHKFEIIGGKDNNNKPILETVQMKISGGNINRYFSSIQGSVESGLLKRHYLDIFKNLNTYYTSNHPSISLAEYMEYFQLFSFSFSASGMVDKDSIPLCQAGTASLFFTFSEPTKQNSLQNMTVMGIYPSILECNKDKQYMASYRTS